MEELIDFIKISKKNEKTRKRAKSKKRKEKKKTIEISKLLFYSLIKPK